MDSLCNKIHPSERCGPDKITKKSRVLFVIVFLNIMLVAHFVAKHTLETHTEKLGELDYFSMLYSMAMTRDLQMIDKSLYTASFIQKMFYRSDIDIDI